LETPKKKKKIDRAYKTVRPLFSYRAKERGAKACETRTRSLRLKNENRKGEEKKERGLGNLQSSCGEENDGQTQQ
jgi:hypothetical protein